MEKDPLSNLKITPKAILEICKIEQTKDTNLLVQVVDIKQFPESETKKKIRMKLNISDGSTQICAMMNNFTFNKMEIQVTLNCIIRIKSFMRKLINNRNVIIFLDPPEVVASDIPETIGKPVNYEDVDPEKYPEIYLPKPIIEEKHTSEEESKDDDKDLDQEAIEDLKEELTLGPITKEDNIRNNLDVLAQSRNRSMSSYEISQSTDVVQNTRNYYKTTKDNIYTPLRCLNANCYDWKIKVRVAKKFEKKEWRNARSSGSVLNIHLMDQDGTMIAATFFNQAAELFDPEIQQGKVYLMANGYVKTANKKFAILDNEFTINFDKNAQIIEVEDDTSIHEKHFQFKTIEQIKDMPENSFVDFIGVIHSAGAINEIQLKKGNNKERRLVLAADDSGMIINLSFWGGSCRKISFEGNPVVAVKGARLSNYSGKSLNCPENGTVLKDPDLQRTKDLKLWYSQLTDLSHLRSISTDSKNGEKTQNNERFIEEIPGYLEKEFEQKGIDKNIYFIANGYIRYVKNDDKNVYNSCPEETCKRKVRFLDKTRTWRCDSCHQSYNTCKPTYILQVNFMDFTSSFHISFYRNMGNELINVPAEQILQLRNDQQFHKVSEIFQKPNFRKLKVLVKAKKQMYNNEAKVVFLATRVYPYSYAQENAVLLDRLKVYEMNY